MQMNGGCFWMNDIFVISIAFSVQWIIVLFRLKTRFTIQIDNACI
jgi:hypothetical protein